MAREHPDDRVGEIIHIFAERATPAARQVVPSPALMGMAQAFKLVDKCQGGMVQFNGLQGFLQ